MFAGGTLAASAAVSLFDERIARWARQPRIQGDSSRVDLVESLTRINELPLTLAAIATYGAGRLTHSNTITDVGLHTTEALVMTIAVSELLRVPIGRRRPRASLDDAFDFNIGSGLTNFDDRSFPSLNASAAFATASALVGEIRVRRPAAVKYAAPLLYGAAMVPGLTRIHLDQHWASDIVAGTLLGGFLGARIVSYAHSHAGNWIDRALMGATVVPDGQGNILVAMRLQ